MQMNCILKQKDLWGLLNKFFAFADETPCIIEREKIKDNSIAGRIKNAMVKSSTICLAILGVVSLACSILMSKIMLENDLTEISQITDVVQNNSATAQESSAVCEELTAQAMSLNELVEEFSIA